MKDMKNDKKEEGFLEVFTEGMTTKNIPQTIENQEKREQKKVKEFQLLPKKYNPYERKHLGYTDIKKAYEKLDIEIIKEYDDLFFEVKLPEGWRIENTEHSMWNNLIDDKNRKRANFFYKGAFYDCNAFICFLCRYAIQDKFVEPNNFHNLQKYVICVDTVNDNILFKTEIVEKGCFDDKERESCKEYMKKNFPNYKNEFAYW